MKRLDEAAARVLTLAKRLVARHEAGETDFDRELWELGSVLRSVNHECDDALPTDPAGYADRDRFTRVLGVLHRQLYRLAGPEDATARAHFDRIISALCFGDFNAVMQDAQALEVLDEALRRVPGSLWDWDFEHMLETVRYLQLLQLVLEDGPLSLDTFEDVQLVDDSADEYEEYDEYEEIEEEEEEEDSDPWSE